MKKVFELAAFCFLADLAAGFLSPQMSGLFGLMVLVVVLAGLTIDFFEHRVSTKSKAAGYRKSGDGSQKSERVAAHDRQFGDICKPCNENKVLVGAR
jgi:hypothetical protein